ncbi:MAG: hypothetical protein ACOC6F_02525 [bacterium]
MSREGVSSNRLKGVIKRKLLWGVDAVGARLRGDTDLKDTIVVAGVPRGGTTWLMEILATLPDYRTVFEPLNPVWFRVVGEMGLGPRLYLPLEAEAPRVRGYLTKALTGNVCSTSPHHPLTPQAMGRRLRGRRTIVKFVRANSLLPWLATGFHVRRIYVIIRHPCAVVESQMRTGVTGHSILSEVCLFPSGVGRGRWRIYGKIGERSKDREVEIADLLAGASQVPEIRENRALLGKIETLETEEELLAALWCIDHLIPLSDLGSRLWHTVFYEKLVTEGGEVLKEVFGTIGEEVPYGAYAKLGTPSSTARSDLRERSGALSRWKRSLSQDQIHRILRIVDWFGFKAYSTDPEPDYGALRTG